MDMCIFNLKSCLLVILQDSGERLIDQTMTIEEIKILRWLSGVTKEDQNMRNEYKNKYYRSGSNSR